MNEIITEASGWKNRALLSCQGAGFPVENSEKKEDLHLDAINFLGTEKQLNGMGKTAKI